MTETKAPAGYVMDAPSTNVVIGANGDTQTVIVTNTRKGSLVVEKYDSVTKQPLSGAQFHITTASGELVPDNEGLTSSNGLYTTNAEGQIVLSNLLPGTYVVTETKAPDNYRQDPNPQTVVVNVRDTQIKTVEGFVLDGTPQDILIKAGTVQQLTFWNKRAGTLVIQKKDKVSGEMIPGAQFQLTYANGGFVDNDNGHLSSNGLYTTDDKGEIRISSIIGTVVVKETKPAAGYVIDQSTQTQTVTVNPLDTQTLTFLNGAAGAHLPALGVR